MKKLHLWYDKIRRKFSENKKSAITYFLLIIILILLILNLIIPLRLPFDVNIWGTVSDWIIALFTGYSALFLVRNFYLQKKLDSLKIMPLFEIGKIIESEEIQETVLILKLVKNNARNIADSRIYNYFTLNSHCFVPMHTELLLEGRSLTLNVNLNAQPNECKFIFTFQDILGSSYKQTIVFLGNRRYKLEAPILIRDEL